MLVAVETPSQKRYIYQLDQLLRRQGRYFGSTAALVPPQQKKINLKSLTLSELFSQPAAIAKLGSLVCNVSVAGKVVYTSPGVLHEVLSNKPVFDLQNVTVSSDVQISVFVLNKMQKAEKVARR